MENKIRRASGLKPEHLEYITRRKQFINYLNKEVRIYTQGLPCDFIGTLVEVKYYKRFDLVGAMVINDDGKKLLVFNPNHIKLYK